MLVLIHGSDTAASRKYLLEQKQLYADATILEPDSVNLTDVMQVFDGGGLFVESKQLILEQFISKRKKSGDYKAIITYLEAQSAEHTIIVWENKELDIATLKAFKNPIIKAFKLPQTLFLFLDSIKPGNGKQLVKLYHQTIASTEAEMVFAMLIRQLRLLIALHPDQAAAENQIDEVKRLSWQKAKLEKQAAAFEYQKLITRYQQLYALEAGQKTGTLALPLSQAIDFFLLDV